MKTVILKYNAGNVRSVAFALERLGIEPVISDVESELRSADCIVFPGVGEAGTAMKHLRKTNLDKLIPELKQPVLGICLGMQLMCRHSEEGNTDCLGIFDQDVRKFEVSSAVIPGLKVPQIGWNTVGSLKGPLFKGITDQEYMYFVHGYFAEEGSETVAVTEYGIKYSSALHRDNFFAVQFHPEKSGKAGQKILENFIRMSK